MKNRSGFKKTQQPSCLPVYKLLRFHGPLVSWFVAYLKAVSKCQSSVGVQASHLQKTSAHMANVLSEDSHRFLPDIFFQDLQRDRICSHWQCVLAYTTNRSHM